MLRILTLLLITLFFGCTEKADLQEALPSPAQASGQFATKPKLILDTDTANEIDDLYAIARLLPDTSIDLLGINSAQWFHVWSGDSTVYQSQRLNEELLTIAGRPDIPHPLGSDLIMGKPWGDYDPRPSPASDFIIEQVRALPEGEKIVVMPIGAATNLASAIAIEPEIARKIVVYTLGFRYDFEGNFWNKDEFNIRRDLNAANFLLNQEDLELHIMPINVAIEYTWQRSDVFTRLGQIGPMGDYLKQKWLERFAENDSWVMWDVALVQAFIHPELAEETTVLTPPENTRRSVYMYTDIDFDGMYGDYWKAVGLLDGASGF